jgi:hypothetical protein
MSQAVVLQTFLCIHMSPDCNVILALVVQLVCLGLLAEVCVRTYFESQPRPVYRIREVATSATR